MMLSFKLKPAELKKFELWGFNPGKIRAYVNHSPEADYYQITYPIGFFKRIKVESRFRDYMDWEAFIETQVRMLREEYLKHTK